MGQSSERTLQQFTSDVIPVSRLAWNDDYAPDGWDYEQFGRFNGGRSDVVFMSYDPDGVGGIYTPGAGEYVDDYDVEDRTSPHPLCRIG